MKLSPRDAQAYFKSPDRNAAGLLIFGEDATRVALRRRDVVAALLGPEAEGEMRLNRVAAADLRSDPAALLDAVKAVGFFPGPRGVVIDAATDGLAPIFAEALSSWAAGDAQIIATAGRLTAKSPLRKLFEGHKSAYAAAIYDDPPGRAEIEDLLRAAEIKSVSRAAWADLEALARTLPPGDFRQTIDTLGLYKHSDDTEVSPADIDAVAPLTRDAGVDDVLDAAADAAVDRIGPLLARLSAQGVSPVNLCILALRHFRALYAAAIHPGGPAAGLSALRPPVFGTRRDRMQRQAHAWGARQLETALSLLVDTDLTLRSTAAAPQMAVMERALIRLAMMPRTERRG